MEIGITLAIDGGPEGVDGLVEQARDVEARGLDAAWMPQMFGFDALGALTAIGRDVPRLRLGSAVTPSYPRHPHSLAMQAITTASATGERFRLGIGLSHRLVIEDMLGFSYAQPAKHMREYLQVLAPLLRGERVSFDGSEYRVRGL